MNAQKHFQLFRSPHFHQPPSPTPSPTPEPSPTPPPDKPDLTISGLIAYCIPPDDSLTWIEFWVNNAGNAPASTEFSVSIAAYGKKNVHNIPYLAPEESVHITDSSLFTFCSLPYPGICCAPGSTVAVHADTTEVIEESNEENNFLATYVK